MSFGNDVSTWLDSKFLLTKRETSIGQEFRAATATFLTMSYILLVNPQLLSKIGIPPTAVVVSTALASFAGSFVAGYFGNLPLGLAPGIGLSAYLTYGLVMGTGLSVQEAFTACFVAGIVLLFLSVTGLSSVVMKLIPRSVKLATIVGMGLQIALVGMTSVKLVVPNEQTIVGLGDIHSPEIWLSIIGLVLIGSLLFHQVQGGILIGIFVMTLIDWVMNKHFPSEFVQFPDLRIDMSQFISFENFDVGRCMTGILAFLFIGVIDVSGVIFGMASLAKLTEPDGTIPGATPTFVAVALSTIVSACTGGTPVIVYVESAAGIKEGGSTGLTAVFISFYFILSLFFAPVLSVIPLIATAPVAILVGAMMMSQSTEIDWNNMAEAIPAFLTLVTMPFTFSITNGIVLGLITAFMFYVTTGEIFKDFWAICGYGMPGSDPLSLELAPLAGPRGSQDAHDHHHASYGGHSHAHCDRPGGVSRHNSGNLSDSGAAPVVVENYAFMDDQPFVRAPSLILKRRDAEAVRNAKGRSLSIDEGHVAPSAAAHAHAHHHHNHANA